MHVHQDLLNTKDTDDIPLPWLITWYSSTVYVGMVQHSVFTLYNIVNLSFKDIKEENM